MKIGWTRFLSWGAAIVLAASACGSSDGGGPRTDGGASGSGDSDGAGDGDATDDGGTGDDGTGDDRPTDAGTDDDGTSGEGPHNPVSYECDGTEPVGVPRETCAIATRDPDLQQENVDCIKCLMAQPDCCSSLQACYATSPNNQCGYGGTAGQGEYLCIQDCLLLKIKSNGSYSAEDEEQCAGDCAPTCGGLPGLATSEILSCMHINCEDKCFPSAL